MIAAVLPLRGGLQAKSRLAGLLSPEERKGLVEAMAEDVLAALAAVAALDRLVVVTGDADISALARRFGAEVAAEPQPAGYREAARSAVAGLADAGVEGVLCLPGDLPTLTPADVETLIAAIAEAPAVALAPSRQEDGTNAVAMTPPLPELLLFGPDSFHRHVDAARALGREPAILRRPGLALDVDTPEDLRFLVEKGAIGATGAYLASQGIIRRI